MELLAMLKERAQRDLDLLTRNSRRGDDLPKPRQVQFEFVADSEQQASRAADFISACGYGDAQASDDPNWSGMGNTPGEWRVIVCIMIPLSPHQLCCTSGLMSALSLVLGLRYDGWACPLKTV